MKVKRDIAIDIFKKMGYKVATKWSSDRLARMIKRIPNLINEAVDYKLNDTESLWLDKVLGKIEDDKNVEFEIINGKKKTKKRTTTEENPEEQGASTTEENPEEQGASTTEENPEEQGASTTKKKTKKKATTKKTGEKKETIYDKAVVVVRQQKGEFTARKLVDDIVNTSNLKKSTASLVIQMAMSYGVAIGELEKIRHGIYKPIT